MSNNWTGGSFILVAVGSDDNNGKPPEASNRRRASQIVHDDRGNARVEWIEGRFAGEPLERAPLSIENTPARGQHAKLTVERNRPSGFDPYQRAGHAGMPAEQKKQGGKRDLRKLGEWIKLKRELDAKKADEPESD